MMARAQDTVIDWIRRGFGEDPEEWVLVLVAVGALVVLAFLLHGLFSLRGWRGARRGRKRFRRFAQASGLTAEESELLLSAAETAGLDEPAAIFFRRSAFEDVARRLNATPDRLGALRNKVYGP